MTTSPFLSQQQFQQLSQEQQQAQLRKRLQYLFDKQKVVNEVLKTCRNYEDMITPYGDAYLLNRTV